MAGCGSGQMATAFTSNLNDFDEFSR